MMCLHELESVCICKMKDLIYKVHMKSGNL